MRSMPMFSCEYQYGNLFQLTIQLILRSVTSANFINNLALSTELIKKAVGHQAFSDCAQQLLSNFLRFLQPRAIYMASFGFRAHMKHNKGNDFMKNIDL